MPIEIRELVIKANVESAQGTQSQPAGSAGGAQGNTSQGEDAIKACVDKLLDILKDKNER
jgi:hypothetical protein